MHHVTGLDRRGRGAYHGDRAGSASVRDRRSAHDSIAPIMRALMGETHAGLSTNEGSLAGRRRHEAAREASESSTLTCAKSAPEGIRTSNLLYAVTPGAALIVASTREACTAYDLVVFAKKAVMTSPERSRRIMPVVGV